MTQQFLDPIPSDVPLIAIDQREDPIFDKILSGLGARTQRKVLDVGDFICSVRLAIERKTRSDFEQSVIDGRLFSQLPNLVSNYTCVVIIVEGIANEERLNRNSLLGAYSSVIADYGASLIFTRDMQATAELVFHFAKHEQIAKKQPMRIYAKKKTHTPSQGARSIVESLPMVGPKLAKSLLSHFGSVGAVFNATEKELMQVDKMGKKKAKLIFDILKYEYNDEEDKFDI
ncbi:hypothetical protein KKF81_00890 [Candidatus Micrarchaeota archaeon]|nr:hypothetical protein [Candidatus Micrarchaeota archaeon]MBU1165475.1 hypothetical protein [Candidatus Micrarchaeota archaeon]MBU1886313.1 hypothetical protein [Candidatus Micrarchaeota archaeon]